MADEQSSPKKRVGFLGWIKRLILLVVLVAAGGAGFWYYQTEREAEVLRGIIERLTAEDRVADVWVEEITKDEAGGAESLKLKILKYYREGKKLKPLEPIYCTFSLNNVIHFEALVIRLNDEIVKGGEGKSIHLFRRAFALDDDGNTYEACVLNKLDEVPGGYRLAGDDPGVREIEWRSFWKYALDEEHRKVAGVKNAQIEAPATLFVPDKIYRLLLEADGGLRIEARPVPEILKGEHVKIHAPTKDERR